MSFAQAYRINDSMTPQRFIPGPGTERLFRDALGAFATGVTVVTARSALGPLGMTANSFSSLSLDPPLVLWSPARASKRFETLAGADHFAIHVLGADQYDLALRFAAQGHSFDDLAVETSADGVPLIPGCLSVFECTREAVHDGGDHAIVVGRVMAAQHRAGEPLIFHEGAFGSVAPL